jgi:hypothetical protein
MMRRARHSPATAPQSASRLAQVIMAAPPMLGCDIRKLHPQTLE